jgi:putative membrane protein
MLVFRNQTAYSRFWNGRCHLSTVTTAVRCLSRQILVLVPAPTFSGLQSINSTDSLIPRFSRESTSGDKTPTSGETALSPADQAKTLETVKILIAMLYTIKNHLRAEWGVALSPGTSLTADGQEANTDEYKDLLPPGLKGYEHRGLGLTLELACFVEKYIQMGVKKYANVLPILCSILI